MEEKDVNNSVDAQNIASDQYEKSVEDIPAEEQGQSKQEQRINQLEQELGEMKEKYIRQVAEFDNYRKRTSRERLDLIQTAGKEVIVSLLDVMDDCDRAQKQMEQMNDPVLIKEGVLLIFNKLRNILQSRGVKSMESLNQAFNPDMHEAITEVPAPKEAQIGSVLDEVQKGYYLNDKIIRFAKVVVGK